MSMTFRIFQSSVTLRKTVRLKSVSSYNRALLHSEEFQMLNLLVERDILSLEAFLHIQMKQRQNSPERWFDLLEIQHHIGRDFSSEIQTAILEFSICPLLIRSVQSKLAMFLIAEVDANTFYRFYQSSLKEFTTWQIQLGNEYIRKNV